MKKITLIIVVSFITNLSFTQEEKKKFSAIGFEVYQNMSYRSNTFLKDKDHEEKPIYGYSFGLNAKVFKKKNITFVSALTYTKMGYVATFDNLIFDDESDPYFASYLENKVEYNYIDIQFGANYYFLNKKIKIYGAFVSEVNIYVSSKETITGYAANGNQNFRLENKGVKEYVDFSANIGGGIEFDLSNKINFFGQPNFKIMLLDSVEKKYSAGLKLGLRLKL